MKPGNGLRVLGARVALAAIAIAGVLIISPHGRADDREGRDDGDARIERGFGDPRIQRGFDIAPVPLNLKGKNRAWVGLGSYIVNAQADCNGCHSAGPATEYTRGGNPYFGQPEKVNPATYLGGGRDFGTISGPPSPHIISRNLTPSTKTGLPEGDHTFPEFLQILRTGKDPDHLHPNCSSTVTTDCFPPVPPFDGDLLQIMPWPVHQHMTDHEIRAIYEYLKAIPCVQGNYPGEPADRCMTE